MINEDVHSVLLYNVYQNTEITCKYKPKRSNKGNIKSPIDGLNKCATINNNMSILRGSCHQGGERFNIDSRGKQCTGRAAVACVAFPS